MGYHRVQPGETVYAIGRAYGVRPDAIAVCSRLLNPGLIHPGQDLAIPVVAWAPIPPGPAAVRQFGGYSSCRFHHTVQRGENLFRISLRYGVGLQSLAYANGIRNLDYIRAGQVLCIP